ncbi:MAG: hypothetical protein HPY64_10690 [Anaerolineae bacterium]|nr:hypothetical protein [Anaerolineae bacterium]
MSVLYHIQVDWDDDGDFDRPDETLDRDVIGAEWALGLDAPDDCLAAPSRATITVRDPGGRYRPENIAGPLYGALVPRKKVVISSSASGVTRAHFTGWIETIAPGRDRTTAIACSGVEDLLHRAEVFLPPATDCSADGLIAAVLEQVDHPPALLGYWRLGLARLGVDTRLPDLTTGADLEPGRTIFPYTGDSWAAGLNAWEVIRAAVEAERGLCFVSREGRLIFWNRHHLVGPVTPVLTLGRREAAFTSPVAGARMINRAEVTCHPREVGGSPETLWTLCAPLRLPPGEARTIRARYADEVGAPLGALSLLAPVAGTDYSANDQRDGSGQDCTAAVTVAVEAGAGSARLTFYNSHPAAVYVLPGARLRGIAIRDRGRITAAAEDGASILRYGRRVRRLDLPLLGQPDAAASLARHLVNEGSAPRGLVATVTVHGETNAALLDAILGLTIGDAIRLADPGNGHDGLYHIVGECHTLSGGGAHHAVTWTLRPVSPLVYWRLGMPGAGELGEATRVIY